MDSRLFDNANELRDELWGLLDYELWGVLGEAAQRALCRDLRFPLKTEAAHGLSLA